MYLRKKTLRLVITFGLLVAGVAALSPMPTAGAAIIDNSSICKSTTIEVPISWNSTKGCTAATNQPWHLSAGLDGPGGKEYYVRKVLWQKNGDLAAYSVSQSGVSTLVWHSNTAGKGESISLETNGSIVIFGKPGRGNRPNPIWSANPMPNSFKHPYYDFGIDYHISNGVVSSKLSIDARGTKLETSQQVTVWQRNLGGK